MGTSHHQLVSDSNSKNFNVDLAIEEMYRLFKTRLGSNFFSFHLNILCRTISSIYQYNMEISCFFLACYSTEENVA